MNRRNFFRSMIGGVAAAAAVRTFPFRVFSFPTDLRILNPIVGQTLYRTIDGGNNYINLGRIQALELENIAQEIPDLIRSEQTLYRYIKKKRTIEVFKRDELTGQIHPAAGAAADPGAETD